MFTQKKFWLGALLGVLLFVVVAGTTFGVALYRYNWDGPVVQAITKFLPYSAMKVNRYSYSYYDYLSDLKSLRDFVANNPDVQITESEMKISSLQTALDSFLLEELAERYDISVSEEEYNDTLNLFLNVEAATEDDIANFETWLQDTYGWSLETYKEKVLRLLILSDKARVKLINDLSIERNSYAKETLDQVFVQLNEGADFAEMAQAYSEDGSAADGGSLGWFAASDMVPEFVSEIEKLEVGQYSQVFSTVYGYHIAKLDDKRVNEETGLTEYNASHIVILGQDFDDYLYEARTKANIDLNIQGVTVDELLY